MPINPKAVWTAAAFGIKSQVIMKLGLRMLNSGLRHKFRMGLILACAPVFALTAAADNLIGTSVKLRALDKVTATTQDFTVAIGDALNYGSLRVDVKHCEKKPPEEIPETYAFLQIFDNRTNGQGRNVEAEMIPMSCGNKLKSALSLKTGFMLQGDFKFCLIRIARNFDSAHTPQVIGNELGI